MIGDKLIIRNKHHKAARAILQLIISDIKQSRNRYVITIAGESGSGKSVTAVALKEALQKVKFSSVILQQDDYFKKPPKSNDQNRRQNIDLVGLQEVQLGLLDQHLKLTKGGVDSITKPLVFYEENSIIQETVDLTGISIVIAEGTYTTSLANVDCRIFIDITYSETKNSRMERAREQQDNFLEQVLKIEHTIISAQKSMADLIITQDFDVVKT